MQSHGYLPRQTPSLLLLALFKSPFLDSGRTVLAATMLGILSLGLGEDTACSMAKVGVHGHSGVILPLLVYLHRCLWGHLHLVPKSWFVSPTSQCLVCPLLGSPGKPPSPIKVCPHWDLPWRTEPCRFCSWLALYLWIGARVQQLCMDCCQAYQALV